MARTQTPPPPPPPAASRTRAPRTSNVHLLAISMFSSGFCLGVSVIAIVHALIR